jgi:serine/threonine protein kinase
MYISVRMYICVYQAVAYLHSRGICHRDLKPENLLYLSNDEGMREYRQIKVLSLSLSIDDIYVRTYVRMYTLSLFLLIICTYVCTYACMCYILSLSPSLPPSLSLSLPPLSLILYHLSNDEGMREYR